MESCIVNIGIRWEWSASRRGRFSPEDSPLYPPSRSLGKPQSPPGCSEDLLAFWRIEAPVPWFASP